MEITFPSTFLWGTATAAHQNRRLSLRIRGHRARAEPTTTTGGVSERGWKQA